MNVGFGRSYTEMVPGRLAVMNRPGMYSSLRDDLKFLRERGVGAIVSLTVSALDAAELARAEIECLHEPVTDFTPPSPGQLEGIIAFIRRQNETRSCTVLVHCGAGLGRSGTVAAAFMVSEGMGPTAAIERVRELRPYSIETPEQEDAVAKYAEGLRRG
ncbi:MAG: protein-tyrosine phosphatase family protein [Planctomycetota bacterium]